jgi:hypothetical protein
MYDDGLVMCHVSHLHFCLLIGCSRRRVCRLLYMCASNSGVGPDEKKTSIEVNKQATVYES